MSSQEKSPPECRLWDPTSCVGTEGCPPRCPRFVDRYGEPILIRPSQEGDCDQLVSFYVDYPSEHRSMLLPPLGETAVRAWIERLLARGKNLVAFHGGRLIGHVLYSPEDADESELLVFLDEEYHSRGIGTELCQQAIAYAAAGGQDAITLRVATGNVGAIGVYDRLGFQTVETHPDNIEMRLDIDQQLARQVQAPPADRTETATSP